MNKVYIVTSGSYSDYHIDCVFDSKQAAAEYMSTKKPYESMIEEYEVNQLNSNPRDIYKVKMMHDGVIEYAKITNVDEYSNVPHYHMILSEDKKKFLFIYLTYSCFADDEKHAIKITNEYRLQKIADMARWEKIHGQRR